MIIMYERKILPVDVRAEHASGRSPKEVSSLGQDAYIYSSLPAGYRSAYGRRLGQTKSVWSRCES